MISARSVARSASEAVTSVTLCRDLQSLSSYWRADGEPIKVRPLGGAAVRIRPQTSDREVLRSGLRGAAHLPPIPDPAVIWDLGANIGITVAHMAHLFPFARITGVELDPENYRLALENTRPWADRCELLNAAAWVEDGTVGFRRRPGREAGVKVAKGGDDVNAISLNRLLERTGPPDYVKMDVEGAERALLSENVEWASSTRSIKVELHGDYEVDACLADLGRLGFEAREAKQPWWPPNRGRPYVVGLRSR